MMLMHLNITVARAFCLCLFLLYVNRSLVPSFLHFLALVDQLCMYRF